MPEKSTSALKLENFHLRPEGKPFELDVRNGGILTVFVRDRKALSSLFDSIAGFRPPAGGGILVGGEEMGARRAGTRRIALVSDRDPLFPHLTLRQNIAFPLRAAAVHRADRAATVNRLIALLGLDGAEGLRPSALTAEQRIRATLARALASRPAVLLLDTLFADIPFEETRRLSALLVKLPRATGTAILHGVSRRDEALLLGGEIAVFQGDTLRQCADAARLYEQPAHAEVAVTFGEANALTGQILEIADDIALIHLACGERAEAIPSETLKTGQTCLVCVRPDRIAPFFGPASLHEDGEPSPLKTTLIDCRHLGDHIRMRVRCADGTELELRRPPLQARQIPRTGASVQVAWPAAHAMAFPL